MKITLISPPFGEYVKSSKLISLARLDEIQKSEGLPIAPPVLEYLAGLTEKVAPDVELELIDANREELDVEALSADLVGISVLTPQAPWAYRTAERLRQRGVRVVFGGMHVTVLPEEAKRYADSVVIGEAEGAWEGLIKDIRDSKDSVKTKLKPFYHGPQLPLVGLPTDFAEPLPDVLERGRQYLGGRYREVHRALR
jgi:radical SAM superfamily enzyme YgiQ (UPF0313 family)